MSTTATLTDIAGDYTLDVSHSRLGFVARHAMVTKVRGQFGEFEGTAHVDTDTPADSKVDVTIQTASISHRQPRPRRSPAVRRLLRRRDVPDHRLPLHRRLPRRRPPGRSPAT